ncbi:MAG: hypothetical protein ACYC3S_12885 [Chloroflexota bacterium]
MGIGELLAKISDPYERQARLYPALLAILPLVVMLGLLYAAKTTILTGVVTVAASCGGLYLLTNVSRELGKRLEPELFKAWGGKPSTQLLRHRDTTIEGVTKQRYHTFLSVKINEPFPNMEREATDPQAADDVYESAVRWLLNQTRDTTKFSLLFAENVAYGFRRNALGLKVFGVASSLFSAGWTLAAHGAIKVSPNVFIDQTALATLPESAIVALAVSVLMLVVWLVFFTRQTARRAAFTYAETLLRTCDALNVE